MSGTGYVPLPAPVTADPGFWKQGIEGLNALRDQQAKQASADAYRQATDPATGQVDVPKFNALIARGPGAWNAGQFMQQQGQAAGAQANAGTAQVSKASAIYNMAGTASASLMNDPSDANIDNIEAGLRASGAPPEVLAELDRIKGIQDPAQRKVIAYQHTVSMMDAQYRLTAGGFPTPTVTQFGGTSAPVIVTPTTPYGPGTMTVGGGVAHAPSPETYYTPQSNTVWLDANGQVTTDPSKVARTITRDIPRGPAMGAPPPGSVGGPQGGGPSTAPPPGALPPGAPPPLPGQRLVGGRFVTPSAAPAPNAAAPSPPVLPATTPPVAAPPPVSTSSTLRGPGSPATLPAVPAPNAANPPPAPAPAPIGGVITAPPQGQPDLLAKDNEVRTQANLAMPDQQKRLIAGQSALDALNLAKYTGPSTGWVARANAFLKAQGISTVDQGTMSETDYRQILQKNLLRFAQSSAKSTGTDLGLETQLHSNANVDEMLPGANRHVLIQDLGILKRDIAQTQEMPASGPAGSVVKHVGTFSANTAPEAFMWNHYTQDERDAIEAQYAKDGKTKQLHDSLALAVRRGAIPDPRKAGPQKQSFLAPPQPEQNPLQMTG